MVECFVPRGESKPTLPSSVRKDSMLMHLWTPPLYFLPLKPQSAILLSATSITL